MERPAEGTGGPTPAPRAQGPASVSLHPAGAVVTFGPFRFDRANRLLSRAGQELALPPRVLGVLEHLVERPGSVVSKQALMDAVWRDAYVSETSLTEAVSVLRQALSDDPQQPAFVQTVHRRGYRFVAHVTVEAPGAPRAGPAPGPNAGRAPDEEPHPAAASSQDVAGAPARTAAAVFGLRSVVILVVSLLAGWLLGRLGAPRAETRPVARLSISLPSALMVGPDAPPALALSPDGAQFVFAARADEPADEGRPDKPPRRLYVRALERFDAQPLTGTEDAESPFFSSDGRWIAFFAGGQLKKVALAGGPPVTLCEVRYAMGGAWGADGNIVFGGWDGLRRVPAAGGTSQLLAPTDSRSGASGYFWPEVLPGAETVVFTVWPAEGLDGARLATLSLRAPETAPRTLVDGASCARYTDSGHLVFARQSRLMAVPLDARGTLRGAPVGLFDGVAVGWFNGAAQFALSRAGTLAFVPGSHEVPAQTLAAADRAGREAPLPLAPQPFMNLAVDPQGRRVALTVHQGKGSDLWLADLQRGSLERLTSDPHNIEPVWTPDGRHVTFAACRKGPCNLAWIAADGSGGVETLLRSERHQYPTGWSPDGRSLLFVETHPERAADLWLLPAEGPRVPRLLLGTRFDEAGGRFSPDGRAIAYVSGETGRPEVYLRPFPALHPKLQVSSEGGDDPRFRAGGRELVFRTKHAFYAAAIETAPELKAGPPRRLFTVESVTAYALLPDGRFLWIRGPHGRAVRAVDLVLGWSAELRRLAPSR